MKKLNVFLASALSTLALTAAEIGEVIVRQQWPWSTDIKIEYTLSDVTAPVDITVKAYDGNEELPIPDGALVGDVYGVTKGGVHAILLDPVKVFGAEKVALPDFSVKLSVADSTEDMDEAVYKIFDLDSGDCTDVTRRDLLNGRYGSYERDFGKIGAGYKTSLSDVLIWTGVTNDIAYKTTKLVMRKVNAAGKIWKIGSPEGEPGRQKSDADGWETQHDVKLTEDYYIGVFELTQAQCLKVWGQNPSYFPSADDSPYRPVEGVRYAQMRGYRGNKSGGTPNECVNWPTNSYKHLVRYDSVCGKLRSKCTVHFDLPTEAQWEFACRAGTTSGIYTGESFASESEHSALVGPLSWNELNSAVDGTKQTHPVGLKRPNAFGLYDMYGNVMEQCLDWSVNDIDVYKSGDPLVDPDGGTVPNAKMSRQQRGSCYSHNARTSRSAYRTPGSYWSDEERSQLYGLRVVCPATASGLWE